MEVQSESFRQARLHPLLNYRDLEINSSVCAEIQQGKESKSSFSQALLMHKNSAEVKNKNCKKVESIGIISNLVDN